MVMQTSNGSEPVVRDRNARGSDSRLSEKSSGLGGQARLSATGQAVAETVNVAAGIGSVHARRWWILAVMGLVTFVVALDNTVVDAALPSIARSFAAANSTLMWVLNGYILALTGLLLLGGALGDRYGRKRLLATGTAIFGLAALGSALAPTAGALIAMRALMGAGAALMLPATLSIITNVFPREERARAIGAWSTSFALGVIVGPLLGGVLVDGLGWQAVFWIHLPIVALTLLGLRIVPESTDERRLRLDIPGLILGPVGITALVYAFIQGGDLGWTSVPIVTAFIAAGVLLIGFVAVERRSEAPMLRIEFFRQRDFTGPLLVVMVLFFAMVGVLFFFTLYLQLVQGKGAFTAGLLMLPIAGAMMVSAPIAGAVAGRLGPKAIALVGILITLAGMLWMSQIQVDTAYGTLAIGLVMFGVGIGLTLPVLTDTVMAAVPVNEAGIASATNDVSRELCSALGIAILGSAVSGVYRDSVLRALDGAVEPALGATVADGIGAAYAAARELPAALADTVIDAASTSFVGAMTSGMYVGAGFIVASFVIAAVMVPWRMQRQVVSEQAGSVTADEAPSVAPPRIDADLADAIDSRL